MNRLFTDGGVILRNPSPDGGTWAWVRVSDTDQEEERGSGLLLPSQIDVETVSNNNSELYAMIEGIAALPLHWHGEVCSDSMIALGWVFEGFNMAKVPRPLRSVLRDTLFAAQERFVCASPRLLAGHPTKRDLAAGIRVSKAPHLPVSRWNVLCDHLCREESQNSHITLPYHLKAEK